MDLRSEAAEALGAFLLVLFGCGALSLGVLDPLGVALVFGGTIAVCVYALAPLSGAHFNPAVTLAFAATGHFPWRRVPSYLLAQVAGATGAAATLLSLPTPIAPSVTRLHPLVTVPAGLLWEAAATFLLAFVIVAVATDRRVPRGVTGAAIGGAVALGALVAGPLTGGSMNPARSLGPALVAGEFAGLWIYIVAPIVGAVAAMSLHRWLAATSAPVGAPRGRTVPGAGPHVRLAPAPGQAMAPTLAAPAGTEALEREPNPGDT